VAEGGTLAFSVTIDNPVDVAVTADRVTADGTATTADNDYTALAAANVPLFAAGSTSAFTINVDTTGDSKVELDETLSVILSSLAAGGRSVTFSGGGGTLTGTGTITNNDAAVISISDPTVAEGGTLAFSVTIDNPVDVAVTADGVTADGTATTADNDYTALAAANVPLFAAGSTSAFMINVDTTGDAKVELDETLSLILSNLAAGGRAVTFSGGSGTLTGTGTITNNDAAVISISDPSVVEGGVLAFGVTIDNPVDVAVTGDRATADGTATTADSDYTALATANLTLFAAGSSTALTIQVQTTDDSKAELDETLSVILSNLSAGGRAVTFSGGGDTLSGTGTITDDDAAVISISNPSVVEGGLLAFEVTISNPLDVDVTADRVTADGTATVSDNDYTALASANVTLFAAGSSTPLTIEVQTTGDSRVELNETLSLILSNLSASGRAVTFNGGGASLAGTGTITNDDSAVISISGPSVVEGGTLAFNVSIDNPVDVPVTADRATADGSATTADNDYTALATGNVQLFSAGSTTAFTINVDTTGDAKVELNETLNLILSNLAAAGRAVTFSGGGGTLSGTGTITNNDAAVVSISSPNVAEGGTLAFDVTISNPVDVAVTADRETADGSATTVDNDYTALAATNVQLFAAGSTAAFTINVDTAGDSKVELDETLSVILSSLAAGGRSVTFSGGGGTLSGTGTITNNDAAVISISDPSVAEGGTLAFDVAINNPVDVAVTADRATADGTATTTDSDYTTLALANVQLFAEGSTTAFTINVDTTGDAKVELDETLSLILSNLAAGGRAVTFSGGGVTVNGTGTIINNDAAVVSISDPSVAEGGTLAFSVTIDNPVDVAVTADRATADGSATTTDNDYTALAAANVQLFAAGSTTAFTINVNTTGDSKVELNETLSLILSSLAAGGRAVTLSGGGGTLTGSGTITNNDAAVISISSPSVLEGGTLAFSVTIDNPVDVAVTADRVTADGTGTTADNDYTALAAANVQLFAAGSNTPLTIQVQTTDDAKAELDETMSLILSSLAAGGRSVTFNGGGGTLAGTGTITNDDPYVSVQLVAVQVPSATGSNVLPASLDAITLGNTYYVEVWVQDLLAPGVGISGGKVNVDYTTAVVDAVAVVNQDFDLLPDGTIDDPNGVVEDLGGGTLQSGLGVAPQWARLGYVEVLCTGLGEATFDLSPGSAQFGRFGAGNVDWSLVDLGAPIAVDQIGGTRIDMTLVETPSATAGNGEIATLPANEAWVHEWAPFWVEIWVSTPDTTTLAIAQAAVDLQYDTSYLTATEIQYGPAFTQNLTGTIDDTQGRVTAIGGTTQLTDVGDDAYVLLARVRFASTGSDQVPVDEAGRNIGPYDMQLALSSGQTQLVGAGATTPDLGSPPATELWAVVYDIDDNNQVDFGDLSFFAPAFGRPVGSAGSEPPYTWWADFDKTNLVDFGDLSFFAPNFSKSRASGQPITFPLGFPAGWTNAPLDPPLFAERAGGGLITSANGPENGQEVRIDVQLVAVQTPSGSDTAAALPPSLTEVAANETFYVEIWVQDVSSGVGVTGGQVNLSYTTASTDAVALDHGDTFNMFAAGTIHDAGGLVANFGGGTLNGGEGVAPNWARLGYVEYSMTEEQPVLFQLSPGALQFSIFNGGNASGDEVNFGTLQLNALPSTALTIDFNAPGSPTQDPVAATPSVPGYVGVLPTDLWSAERGYGWVISPYSLDRGVLAGSTYSDLLRDGAWQYAPRDFQISLQPGQSYEVTVTLGDPGYSRDKMNVSVVAGSGTGLTDVTTARGQQLHRSFTATPDAQGELVLRFSDGGGDPYWVVSAIEVRPAVTQLTVSGPGSLVVADGSSTDKFNVSGAIPGALYTLSTTLGQIQNVADADPWYAGVQIVAPGSVFSFDVLRGTRGGTAMVRVEQVSGASRGETTQQYEANSTWRFDFNTSTSATADGFLAVGAANTYRADLGYGWQTTAYTFARSTVPSPLLADGHWGTSNTFLADVPDGDYVVNVTFGDGSYARNQLAVRAEGAAVAQLSGVDTAAGQFEHHAFPVTVSGNQLSLQIYSAGGDPYFTINALEIWPAAKTGAHTLSVSGTAVSGTGATAHAMITVGTDAGSVTAAAPDASDLYAGYQVLADDNGDFSFVLVPPGGGGSISIHSEEVTGQRAGSASATVPGPSSRRFDFNGYSNATQDGFTGLRGNKIYNATDGYGWQSTVYELDRGSANKASVDLYRDGHWGWQQKTFDIAVDSNLRYDVRFYLGDASYARNQIQVAAEGGAWQTADSTAANSFTTVVISDIDPTDNVLSLSIRDGGGDPYWVINGLDVWVHGTPAPGEAMLRPSFGRLDRVSAAKADPLTSEILGSVVSIARDYWSATGLTAGQTAELATLPVAIADLSSQGALGVARPEGIWIDDDAAGHGWIVNSAIRASGFDLLTVVTHELGHAIGLEHDDHGLMAPVLAAGERSTMVASWDAMLMDWRLNPAGRRTAADRAESGLSATGRSAQPLAVDRVLADLLVDSSRIRHEDDDEGQAVIESLSRREPSGREIDPLFADFGSDGDIL